MGQQHALLMIVGGWDDDYKTFGDVWLLDVDKAVWSEVGILYTSHCVACNLQACMQTAIAILSASRGKPLADNGGVLVLVVSERMSNTVMLECN